MVVVKITRRYVTVHGHATSPATCAAMSVVAMFVSASPPCRTVGAQRKAPAPSVFRFLRGSPVADAAVAVIKRIASLHPAEVQLLP